MPMESNYRFLRDPILGKDCQLQMTLTENACSCNRWIIRKRDINYFTQAERLRHMFYAIYFNETETFLIILSIWISLSNYTYNLFDTRYPLEVQQKFRHNRIIVNKRLIYQVLSFNNLSTKTVNRDHHHGLSWSYINNISSYINLYFGEVIFYWLKRCALKILCPQQLVLAGILIKDKIWV